MCTCLLTNSRKGCKKNPRNYKNLHKKDAVKGTILIFYFLSCKNSFQLKSLESNHLFEPNRSLNSDHYLVFSFIPCLPNFFVHAFRNGG
mmetsp:Transcript_7077/g.15338  ORF Transcript_7077/g.15338 Transcript_7077/m.15338 type:complete len:89 (+) Transcript_7077:225-491(+)